MLYFVFDMDGTLLDSQRVYVDGWETVGQKHGIAHMGALLPLVCGMNEAGWGAFLMERYPTLDLPRFKQEVFAYVEEHQTVRFKPGAKELLDYLKAKGIKMAVASGTDTPGVKRYLAAVNALDYFDAVIGGDQVKNGKPAPDIYLKAAQALGVDPRDCMAVEDSANGVLSACAAGMRCIGIPDLDPLDRVAQVVYARLKSLDQIIGLVEELVKNS